MSLANVLWLVGLATLPLSARALDEAPMQDGAAKATAEDLDAAALVKQLGDQDHQKRKAAYRALEKLGASARAELQKAAKSDDPEVRWSASLLLDRLDDPLDDSQLKDPAPLRARLIPPRLLPQDGESDDSFHDAIEEMHDSIRRMFGEEFGDQLFDGTMHRFGDDGPFGRFGAQGGTGGLLELGPGSSFSRTFDNNGERESTSIRVGPDGRVKVEQEKNGEKTTIEAESLEALRKEHPELLPEFMDGLGGRGRMSLRIGPFVEPPQPPLLPQPRAPREDATPASRPRLGVQVAPVKADVADYLELEPGVGLEIVRVVPDSAAATIGIQARDILTEVNGRTIRSADDVAKALAGKDPATAEVIVIRRGTEKPFDPSKRPRKQ